MSRMIDADLLGLTDMEIIMCDGDYKEALKMLLDKIEHAPTIDPEPQWILCSKRMPEEHDWIGTKELGTTISDEVYVTFENPRGSNFCKHLSFQNGKLSAFDKSTIDAFHKGSKPIAWMPLPKPWKGEQP